METLLRVHIATVRDESWHRRQADEFIELAAQDTYRLHDHENNPAKADVILFVDLHQLPEDPLLGELRKHPLVRRFREKVAVYDERDAPFFTFPGLYVATERQLARGRRVVGAAYSPSKTSLAGSPEVPQPDLLFSFMGGRTHPVRDALLNIRHDEAVIEDTSRVRLAAGGPNAASDPVARTRFADVLRRSRFVLCPRGFGASSFRIFECLSAGRVPVVISDRWLPPPGIDWDSCSIRVPEDQVATIPRLLEQAAGEWESMSSVAATVWAERLAPASLWNSYCSGLATALARPQWRERPWWAQTEVVWPVLRVARAGARSGRTARAEDPYA